jgi:hypothetical protein
MSLLRLAGSILLALSLASLSALAAGPRTSTLPLSDQGLVSTDEGSARAVEARALALSPAAQRRLHRAMLPAPLTPTIPVAGQSVPGAGQ